MSELTSLKFAILLCTYNGVLHLKQQLDSIRNQGVHQIDIWVSDDGSSDSTLDFLKAYQKEWDKGRFEIKSGPQQGFAANFLSLICDPDIAADYYAYSDQDDIWELDKLTRAVNILKESNSHKPALYCSRTRLVAENGEDVKRLSPQFSRKPSFANALVQSLAGGNTMVLNNKARELVRDAGRQKIISHDWWTYMLVSGADGYIFYDPMPSVHYRQHSNNQIGANMGWYARLCRVKMLMHGNFRDWNNINTQALQQNRHLLSEKSRHILDTFAAARESPVVKRIYLILKSGVYRQTLMGNIALVVAALFNKI